MKGNMKNLNHEIDKIIFKYQLDKHYPDFCKREGDFCEFISWDNKYFNCIDSESIEGLRSLNLMNNLDIVVLEINMRLGDLEENLESEKQKECLERLFFLSIYKRNFLLAEEIFQKLKQNFVNIQKYEEAWEEITALIKYVKHRLKNRKCQDILGIWLDAVCYKDIDEIPYLEEVQKADHTISFSNAYTMTPYTNPTFALIMTGKKRIDDQSYLIEKIDESNSEVISLLKNKGYLCRFLGSYWKKIDDGYRGKTKHYVFAPCSELLWDMVCHLLDSDIPVFVLTHIFSETHSPYLSMNYKKTSIQNKEIRRLQGRQEVDRQLRYYMDFLGGDVIKLYFSDHGDNALSKNVFHTILEVQGKNLKKEKIKEIFSYEKFPELFKQIILNKQIDKAALVSDYAEIQEIPLYNKDIIKKYMIEKKQLGSQHVWGYRGVIDHNFIYLYYGESNGEVRESLMETEEEDYFGNTFILGHYYVCNENIVSYYREIVRKKPMAYMEDEKFKYSRCLQKVVKNAMPRYIHKRRLLNKLFSGLPNHGIAFRGGGLDTGRTLLFYKKELQGVKYIIDQNENCQCSKLDITIIPLDDIGKYPIHTVVFSSKKYASEFREELRNYPSYIQVIDVYQYLEDNGINEKHPFYYFQPDEEDYEEKFTY